MFNIKWILEAGYWDVNWRWEPSGMWHRVVWKICTDVSEEPVFSESLYIRLHGVTSQKTVIFTVIAVGPKVTEAVGCCEYANEHIEFLKRWEVESESVITS
jgi:hypothetical protein